MSVLNSLHGFGSNVAHTNHLILQGSARVHNNLFHSKADKHSVRADRRLNPWESNFDAIKDVWSRLLQERMFSSRRGTFFLYLSNIHVSILLVTRGVRCLQMRWSTTRLSALPLGNHASNPTDSWQARTWSQCGNRRKKLGIQGSQEMFINRWCSWAVELQLLCP